MLACYLDKPSNYSTEEDEKEILKGFPIQQNQRNAKDEQIANSGAIGST